MRQCQDVVKDGCTHATAAVQCSQNRGEAMWMAGMGQSSKVIGIMHVGSESMGAMCMSLKHSTWRRSMSGAMQLVTDYMLSTAAGLQVQCIISGFCMIDMLYVLPCTLT